MLYSATEMPVVFIVSADWDLRGAVRAELREAGIEALGLEIVEDMTRIIASGVAPSLVVLDGEQLQNSQTRQALENLSSRVPSVVIDSPLNPAPPLPGAATMLRPVQIKEILERILAILAAGSESS